MVRISPKVEAWIRIRTTRRRVTLSPNGEEQKKGVQWLGGHDSLPMFLYVSPGRPMLQKIRVMLATHLYFFQGVSSVCLASSALV